MDSSSSVSEYTHILEKFSDVSRLDEFKAWKIIEEDYGIIQDEVISFIDSEINIDIPDPIMSEVDDFMIKFRSFLHYTDRMKLLCESGLSEKALSLVLSQIPIDYSTYYTALGPEKMKSLRYRKGEIEDYYKSTALYESNLLLEKINSNFKVGDRLSSIDIKHKLSEIYKELNLMKTAKATDLGKFFLLKDIKIPSTRDGESIRLRGYELLSKKEK